MYWWKIVTLFLHFIFFSSHFKRGHYDLPLPIPKVSCFRFFGGTWKGFIGFDSTLPLLGDENSVFLSWTAICVIKIICVNFTTFNDIDLVLL